MVATTYGDGSTLGTFARIQIEARWTIRTSVLHTPYSYVLYSKAELGSMIQSLTDELGRYWTSRAMVTRISCNTVEHQYVPNSIRVHPKIPWR